MAKTEIITLKNKSAADKLDAKAAGSHYYPGTGAQISRLDDVSFEIYGGNNSDRAMIRETASKLDKAATKAATPQAADEKPATPRQLAYLTSLVQRDPATAMNCGASVDGSSIRTGLTKNQASALISQMLEG